MRTMPIKIYLDQGHNPDNPNAPIYRDYIDKYAAMDDFPGGYNYEHFTIRDNPATFPLLNKYYH